MLKKEFFKFQSDSRISTPVAYVIFIRIFVKIIIFVSALYFKVSIVDIFIIVLIFLISEIYRNLGTILVSLGKLPEEAVGGIVSAIDGALLVILLYYTNLLSTDLYLFILISIAFDTIEYGLVAAFAEGVTASFSYAAFAFLTMTISPFFILVKVVFIITLSLITGWLSENLKSTQMVLQNTLERTNKEESLNKMKDEFIGAASHNLRTPLSVMKGYIELILNHRVGPINDKQKDYLLNIETNIELLQTSSEDLLNIISLQDNQVTVTPSSNIIYDFLNDIAFDFKWTFKIKGVNLETKFNIPTKKMAIFDNDKLKIAITNILHKAISNARKEVSFKSNIEQQYWTMVIKDDGHGISKKEITDIFNKNQDIFDTMKSLQKNGIGLYISNVIIESHKGHMEIVSVEGVGTTFRIYIPI